MNKFLTIFFTFFVFSIFTLGIFPEAFAAPTVSVEDGSVSIDVNSPFHFDLKADIPGKYKAAASCAYLYYTNEFKHWTDSKSVMIESAKSRLQFC